MKAAEQQQASGTCQVVLGDQPLDRLPLMPRGEVGVALYRAQGLPAGEILEREEINRFHGQARRPVHIPALSGVQQQGSTVATVERDPAAATERSRSRAVASGVETRLLPVTVLTGMTTDIG